MYKRNLLAIICAVGATSAASASDFAGGDWQYNFRGHYSIAEVDATNNGILGNVLGAVFNLTAQLNLINGTTSATNFGTTLTQSSLTNLGVSNLQMPATGGGGLVPLLGNFVYNLLDFSNGAYNGSVSGNNVTLTRGSLVSLGLNGLVDTRILGTGLVLDLQAAIPTSTLTGTVTGIDAGPSAPFGGGRANYITGNAGLMNTIALQARARVYALNIVTLDTGLLNVGVIENTADSWSLSRQPVPEPASLLGIGVGIAGVIARRRKRKNA